jgi:esterase/lipase
MTRQPHLDPSTFFLQGGSTGVLLIHGFTGAPTEMRLLGEHRSGNGLTVAAPRFPGRGPPGAARDRRGGARAG